MRPGSWDVSWAASWLCHVLEGVRRLGGRFAEDLTPVSGYWKSSTNLGERHDVEVGYSSVAKWYRPRSSFL
jgi:hypothetical protein